MKNKIFLILFSVNTVFSFAQCEVENTCFIPGEDLHFNVFYKLGFVWIKTATVNFKVLSDEKSKISDEYHFYGYGETLNSYKWLYNVTDKYESYVDISTLKTKEFEKSKNEDSYNSTVSYFFDNKLKTIKIKSENSEGRKIDTVKENIHCVRDILTTMYYARNLSFDFGENEKISFWIIHDAEISELTAFFGGFDKIKFNGKDIKCYKFRSVMPKGSLFGSNGEITVWVSKDKNKIPIRVSADIIIGKVVVELDKAVNLKYSLSK